MYAVEMQPPYSWDWLTVESIDSHGNPRLSSVWYLPMSEAQAREFCRKHRKARMRLASVCPYNFTQPRFEGVSGVDYLE